MSRRLKVLAGLNVAGWLVAVPLLLSALIGPLVHFDDWPSQRAANGVRGTANGGDVRLARPASGSPSSPDRGGRTRRAGTVAAARSALDRALLQRTIDASPGVAAPPRSGSVRVSLPVSTRVTPSAPVVGGPNRGSAPVVGGPNRGSAPRAVTPPKPPAPDRVDPDVPAAGPGDGIRVPAPPLDVTALPSSGPESPAAAPGGATPAGGAPLPGRSKPKKPKRPGGGRWKEPQVVAQVKGDDGPQEAVDEDEAEDSVVPATAPESPAPADAPPAPTPATVVPVPAGPPPAPPKVETEGPDEPPSPDEDEGKSPPAARPDDVNPAGAPCDDAPAPTS